jgi:hypothetical protein
MEEKSAYPPPPKKNLNEVIAKSYEGLEQKIALFESRVRTICGYLILPAMLVCLLIWRNPGLFIPVGAAMGLVSLHLLVTALTPTRGPRRHLRIPVIPASGGRAVFLLVVMLGLMKLGASPWQLMGGLFLSQIAITVASLSILRPNHLTPPSASPPKDTTDSDDSPGNPAGTLTTEATPPSDDARS